VIHFVHFQNLHSQVDMSKVKLAALKPWITKKVTEIIKMEDDVVVEYVINQLEEKVRNIKCHYFICQNL